MATVISDLDDQGGEIIIEAETMSSLSKFGDRTGDPRAAYRNALLTAATVAKAMGDTLAAMKSEHTVEITFSIKIDAGGSILLSQTPDVGQFRFSVKVSPDIKDSPKGTPKGSPNTKVGRQGLQALRQPRRD